MYTVQSVSHQDYLRLQPFHNRKYGDPEKKSNAAGGNAEQWFYFIRNGVIFWVIELMDGATICLSCHFVKPKKLHKWMLPEQIKKKKADYSSGPICQEGEITEWTPCELMSSNSKFCLKSD